MDFSYTEEQEALRDSVRGFLDSRYTPANRRAIVRSATGWAPDIWQELAAGIGLAGIAVPEGRGGLGFGPVELMIVMEELGRSLVVEPFLESAVVGAAALAATANAKTDAALAGLLDGSATLAMGWQEAGSGFDLTRIATTARRTDAGWSLSGTKAVVAAAPWARYLLVPARTAGTAGDVSGLTLFLVDSAAPGVSLIAYPTVDGRQAADIGFADVSVSDDAVLGTVDGALPLIEELRDRAIAAIAAEAVGVTQRLLDDSVAYVQQRRQFGQPLSSFQVLQHRLVDMHLEVEMARAAAMLVTLKLDAPADERARAAATAKVTIARACRFVGQNAVQLHGGMGMTDELPVGEYFKRATMIENELGSATLHIARHAAAARAAA